MADKPRPLLKATVFSDYICPFCYIGDARLERLREHYDLRVNWCLLEIHPDTPAEGQPVSKLGYEDATWQQMMATLREMAEQDGLELRDQDFTTSSRAALLLAEAAKRNAADLFYKLHQQLFMSLFVDGENIGDRAVLRRIAREVGLPDALIEDAWTNPDYKHYLRQYQLAAEELDVSATPTFFIGEGNTRVDGAVPYQELLDAAKASQPLLL